MEQVLDVYEQPYNPQRPVICFDERPCQLIADILVPIPMKPGCPKREDYHYQRNGTCVIFIAVEPLAGRRVIEVREQKTKRDYAEFMRRLAQQYYKEAEKIVIVQDNLNTHNPSSFYEVFEAQEAFELSKRFEMVYTPKKASWLNMAEIELSALSKQCLERRIADRDTKALEVCPWAEERNRDKITITWQFTKNRARDTLGKFYESVRN